MAANVKTQGLTTSSKSRSAIGSTGLAIFAMFFGAGNIVFPLALGQFTQDKNFYGILGLIITAVFVPLIGLLSMMVYEGNYSTFFSRIGRLPGFFVTVAILGLIGPFGGIPRCITISFSTLDAFGFEPVKWMNLLVFSAITCVLLFLFTYRPRRILSLLGYVLTPILLASLAVIAGKGLFSMPHAEVSLNSRLQTFGQGLLNGYNTLDLLAAFFFSSIVLGCLKKNHGEEVAGEKRKMLKTAILGSLIAAGLLSFVYVCFSFLAAGFSPQLATIPSDQLLGTLAYKLLGPYAGLIATIAVCFACFTTEVALVAVFTGFLHKTLFKEKISYTLALCITIGISFLVSTLQFSGISAFLVPIVRICYPALIVLSVLNLLHKLYGFKPVKRFVYGTLALTCVGYMLMH
jgi:branched-chain amino acid:cation transporter, LIVCS family